MFNALRGQKEIKGEIGYFHLQDWWQTTFTQEERNHIEDVFKPLGSDQKDKPLTESDISYTSQTSSGLLHNLAGWFNNPRDRSIAKRIIDKAYEEAQKGSNVLDLHFTLQTMMEIYYRERDEDSEALDRAIKACEEQIRIAPKAAERFLNEYPNQPLPAHAGYNQLRIILTKQGLYGRAIDFCEQAKKQGWGGDWDKKIEKLRKKKTPNLYSLTLEEIAIVEGKEMNKKRQNQFYKLQRD